MDELSLENWLDIREALQRRLKEVTKAEVLIYEAKKEQARRVNSLNESLEVVELHIKDLRFEIDRNPLPY